MSKIVLYLSSEKNETSEDFTTVFNTPIELDRNRKYGIALKSLDMWNSWYNISENLNNNQITLLYPDLKKVDIIFDNGNYTILDINNYILSFLEVSNEENCPLLFAIDSPTGKLILRLHKGFKVDFSVSDISEILGFEKKFYDNSGIAPFSVNISNGVDSLLVHCDLVRYSCYKSEVINDLLYKFTPNSKPLSQIIINELDPDFYLIKPDFFIQKIRMWITDQEFKKINLNKYTVEYKLILKPLD